MRGVFPESTLPEVPEAGPEFQSPGPAHRPSLGTPNPEEEIDFVMDVCSPTHAWANSNAGAGWCSAVQGFKDAQPGTGKAPARVKPRPGRCGRALSIPLDSLECFARYCGHRFGVSDRGFSFYAF